MHSHMNNMYHFYIFCFYPSLALIKCDVFCWVPKELWGAVIY